MAWSNPRTWASGEIPTAAQLNTDLRDDLNELALHAHGGGSGSGTATLGNLTLLTFIDAAAAAAPGGTLTRVYSSSTGIFWRNAGGIFTAAVAGHEHSIAAVQGFQVGSGDFSGAGGTNSTAVISSFAVDSTQTLISTSVAIGGTGSRAVISAGGVTIYEHVSVGAATANIRIERAGTVLTSGTLAIQSATSIHQQIILAVETNLASGTYTYALVYAGTGGTGTMRVYGRGLAIEEVRQS